MVGASVAVAVAVEKAMNKYALFTSSAFVGDGICSVAVERAMSI